MKSVIKALFSTSAFAMLVACNGTTSDPKSVVKGDLNPPFELQSITSKSQMILQWNITNTEKDIVGYNVYIAEASLASLKGKLPAALQTRYDLASSQIRRCDGTKALFKVFGFSDTDKYAAKSCDDFTPEDSSTTTAAAPSSSSGAAGSGDGKVSAAADAKINFVKCSSSATENIDIGKANLLSVDIAKAITPTSEAIPSTAKARVGSTLRCYINKDTLLSDGKTGFTNGTKYVAFVFAVAGDTANKISYSSNFIEDVPANYTSIPGTLAASQYTSLSFRKTDGVLTGEVGLATEPLSCTDQICKINKALGARPAADVLKDARVFLFADVQAGSERVFLAGEKDQVYLVPQTPRENLYGKPGIYVPGDTALKFDASSAESTSSDAPASASYQSGRNLVAYPGSLFSMVVKDGAGKIHYGKVYLNTLSTDATSAAAFGTKSFSIYAVVQTAIDELLVERLNPLRVGGLH